MKDPVAYPQFYSRVGFVHAFRPLRAAQVRELLQGRWTPSGIALPEAGVIDEEALASIIRATGGNFRLLHRLLTQIARIVEINALQTVTGEVVEAARESLVSAFQKSLPVSGANCRALRFMLSKEAASANFVSC